ncbi:hypothetical protein BHE74_00036669 [Ensete ventricosum]|nr:hypothetical protein BHE74_00036669 [Ensete ventricosum]
MTTLWHILQEYPPLRPLAPCYGLLILTSPPQVESPLVTPSNASLRIMPLTFVQGKIRAFASCSNFYVDSLHAAWILHQVPRKSLRSSICIELILALASTIPRVSRPLSSIFISILSVPSYDVALDCSPT